MPEICPRRPSTKFLKKLWYYSPKTLTFHKGTRHPGDCVPIGTALLLFCIPSCQYLKLYTYLTKNTTLILMGAEESTLSYNRCDCDCVLNIVLCWQHQQEMQDLYNSFADARRRPPSNPAIRLSDTHCLSAMCSRIYILLFHRCHFFCLERFSPCLPVDSKIWVPKFRGVHVRFFFWGKH